MGAIPEPSAAAIALEHLALDEADLKARVLDLETDLVTYRMIAVEAFHALADLTRDRDSYKRKYFHLLGERRASARGRCDGEAVHLGRHPELPQ